MGVAISQAGRFRKWAVQDALPIWAKQGLDKIHGGFHEKLNQDGSPVAGANKRVRVQFRQLYVFSHAHALDWFDGSDIVADVFAFVQNQALCAEQPGCAHLLSPTGEVIDAKRDLYDQAFVVLAMAWAYRAFGDRAFLRVAEKTVAFIDTALKAENGGWRESDCGGDIRRQNPHMHLFEAFLALYEATNEERWLARAGEIAGLFYSRFYDSQRGLLYEFFNQDWSLAASQGENVVEPGHMAEWSWLLQKYGEHTGAPVGNAADRLLRSAIELGCCPKSGLLVDAVLETGAEHMPTRRTWPQTEHIKALAARAKAGDASAAGDLGLAIDNLFGTYLDREQAGLWIDRVGPQGETVEPSAPASTFYHLFCAAAETAPLAPQPARPIFAPTSRETAVAQPLHA